MSRVADETAGDQAGFLTFGPYVTLPAGSYVFEIYYEAQGSQPARLGFWDVTMSTATAEMGQIDQGDIRQGGQHIIRGNFTLDEADVTEIRVFYAGLGKLIVQKLVIWRTK